MGNTDEMLVRPGALEEFASQSAVPAAILTALREIAAATRAALGEGRLLWMGGLPRVHAEPGFSVVHATPQSCWQAPAADATDAELESVYGTLGNPVVVFGHTHRPFVRRTPTRLEVLANTGSVGLSLDGDPRASYMLLDDGEPAIRRVEYDVEKEMRGLACCGLPGAEWTARMLRTSSMHLP